MTGYLVTTTHFLRDVLHLGDNAVAFAPDNPLPGSVPRFDSMAVASSLRIDPCGTGDSESDFADARWAQWRGNSGESLEVAGYTLYSQWAADLDAQHLAERPPVPGMSEAVFEVARDAGPVGPVGRSLRDAWPHVQLEARTLAGESFWTSLEIACVPTLVEASLAFLTEAS